MSEEELKAIEDRAAKATPGPWSAYEDDHVWQLFAEKSERFSWTDEHGEEHVTVMAMHPWQLIKAPKQASRYAEYWPGMGDSDFIVHARTDIPALIAEIRSLRKLVDGG